MFCGDYHQTAVQILQALTDWETGSLIERNPDTTEKGSRMDRSFIWEEEAFQKERRGAFSKDGKSPLSRFELSNEYGANETGRIRHSKRRKKRSVLRGCRTTSSSAIHSRIDSQSLADSLSGVQELKPKCGGNPVSPYENEVEKPGMKVHTPKKGEVSFIKGCLRTLFCCWGWDRCC
ncbi:hypothetical protein Q3G72_000818 [Acer saccharum]|nr:hypothetical protein Q3G72_000818 [Acer saccharum]